MVKFKLKEKNGELCPYMVVNDRDIWMERVTDYYLYQKTDCQPELTITLSPMMKNNHVEFNVDEKMVDKCCMIIDGKPYDLVNMSYIRFMDLILAVKKMWHSLTKEQQDKFLRDSVEKGYYSKMRTYLEA